MLRTCLLKFRFRYTPGHFHTRINIQSTYGYTCGRAKRVNQQTSPCSTLAVTTRSAVQMFPGKSQRATYDPDVFFLQRGDNPRKWFLTQLWSHTGRRHHHSNCNTTIKPQTLVKCQQVSSPQAYPNNAILLESCVYVGNHKNVDADERSRRIPW